MSPESRITSTASIVVTRWRPTVRRLPAAERLGDALFMMLRLTDGVNLDEIRRRYGVDVWQVYGADLEPFVQNGCLMRDCDRLRLTRRGMLLANEVMSVFV